MQKFGFPLAAVAAALVLVGCGGDDETTTEGSAQRTGEGPEWAERPGAKFAYHEMLALAERICGEFGSHEMATTLAGDSHSQDPDIVARHFAAQVAISPIPLQRAAYGGCKRGLKSGDSPAVSAPSPAQGVSRLTRCDPGKFPHGGGYDVEVRGMRCERVGQLLPRFGLSISRDDPNEGIFERGVWTCWSQILPDIGAQNVCWDNDGRILVYKYA